MSQSDHVDADPAGRTHNPARGQARDARRQLQLVLAAIWLLDGVLQLAPFMFTAGRNGFSGMLAGSAAGNPHAIAQSITWNASVVDHHAVAANTAFALIQILLGLGIAWRPTLKAALGASIVWSLGVWWFGEGLGGVLSGSGTTIAGSPGAVLFYAVLAVLVWPADRSGELPPFAAARAVGATTARAIWAVVWLGQAALSLLGSGRSPQGIHDLIESVNSGEPGWLSAIDRHAESAVSGHGLVIAIVLAAVCAIVAVGVYASSHVVRLTLVLAIVVALVIWVVGQNFGMILAGGATDPNSGPLLVLLALSYWPARPMVAAGGEAAERVPGAMTVGVA